ncbi:unnamed protein product [Calypogeia fissa]
MAKEIRDIPWFVKNRGLATEGVDIMTLTNNDISVAEIEEVFQGPKFSKSDYRYDRKPEPNVVLSIEQMYQRVTGKSKVVNFTINQCFARGVVAWLKGEALDWAKYAVHCHKYATDVQATKALNRERKGITGQELAKGVDKLEIVRCYIRGHGKSSQVQSESGSQVSHSSIIDMQPLMPFKFKQP